MEIKYNIIYSDQVLYTDIPKLSAPVKNLIKYNIEKKLLIDSIKFGKPLQYSLKNCRSLRIGDYRVIYQIISTTINVLIIQHRKDSYK